MGKGEEQKKRKEDTREWESNQNAQKYEGERPGRTRGLEGGAPGLRPGILLPRFVTSPLGRPALRINESRKG